MDPARGVVGFVVVVGEPMARVEDEPGLVDGFEAEGVGAAGVACEDGGGGNGLDADG